MNRKIKAVVFDVGGVINDWKGPLRGWLEKFKIDLDQVLIENEDLIAASELGKIPAREFMQKLMNRLGRPNYWQELEKLMPGGFPLYKEVIKLIKELKPKYKLAMLTNIQKGSIDKMEQKWQLKQYFEVVVDSSQVQVRKPDPKIFLILLKRLRVQPEECLYIDDMLINIEAGKKLGFQTVWFTNPVKGVKLIRKILYEAV